MIVKVLKKDGRIVEFRQEHLYNDLDSAERVFKLELKRPKEDLVEEMVEQIEELEQDIVDSQSIFSVVEIVLEEEPAVLAAFREYKNNQQNLLNESMDIELQIKRLESKDRDIVNENANRDSRRFNTQRELLAGVVTKALGLRKLPETVKRAHVKGSVYFHDLDKSPYFGQPNCSLLDFEYLFNHGFKMGGVWIDTPKSLKVAATLLVQVLGDVSGTQYGGLSVHEIDKLLAPYAEMSYQKHLESLEDLPISDELKGKKAYELTLKEIKDSAQTIEYQINTLSTSSAQTPFTTVSLGLGKDKWCKEIQKAILTQRLNGLSDGSTAIFPKILYFLDEGHNLYKEDPFYDVKVLAMKTSARRTYPDMVSMKQMRELKGTNLPITSMGCRSYLQKWIDPETNEEVYAGRQNLGVCSINLGRLGIQARGNFDYFYELLEESLLIAKEGLKFREKVCMDVDIDSNPIMYKYGGLGRPRKNVRDYFANNRATISIGYVGLHNCMTALTGDEHWSNNPEYVKESLNIMGYIQGFADKNQDEFEVYLSVYGTPAESTASKMCKLDRERFGSIPGVTDKGYYENSFHYASYLDTDPYTKIDLESQYLPYTMGGNMIYVESAGLENNLRAFESIWNYMYEHILYGGVNNPIDKCFRCGFEGEFTPTAKGYECPSCHNSEPEEMDVVRRVCGYLGSVERPVVAGKDAEIKNRVDHIK